MTSILKADNIQDADGNNIINESGNTITIGASGDTTNIIGTLQNNGAAVGGANTPAFGAYSSGNISITNATETTVVFDSEYYDSASAYDTSTGKFTPQTAGKYYVYLNAGLLAGSTNKLFEAKLAIYKNGSAYRLHVTKYNEDADIANEATPFVGAVIDFNGSSDYVEGYANANVLSGNVSLDARNTEFGAYRIIGV